MTIISALVLLADFVGTQSYVEPVTQKEQVVFTIRDGGRALKIGCNHKGSGQMAMFIEPAIGETPEDRLFSPVKQRFGKQPEATSALWKAGDETLDYDDGELGSSKRKAIFLNDLAANTEFHIRFNSYRGPVTASFVYDRRIAAFELQRMLVACSPKKVRKELERMGSILADPIGRTQSATNKIDSSR